MITEVVLGWNAKITTRDRIFGTVLDNLLENTEQMILVCKIMQPPNTTNRIVVIVPANAELERGFLRWMRAVRLVATQLGAKVVFMAGRRTINHIKSTVKSSKPAIDATYMPRPTMTEFENNQTGISKDDMVVVVSARKGTVSYNGMLDTVPRVLSRNYKDNSFIIIYPEQYPNLYQDNQFKTTGYTNETTEKESI